MMLNPEDSCLLFGAGGIGSEVVDILEKLSLYPKGFIDNNKTGMLKNLPVYNLKTVPSEYKTLPVIITVFSFPESCGLKSIASLLKQHGFKEIISFESFYLAFCQTFEKNFFWLSPPEYLQQHAQELQAVRNMLSDQESKSLFDSIIRFRMCGKINDSPEKFPVTKQYFDDSVFRKKEFDEFWDIGAFNGDTLNSAIFNGMKFKKVIAFEPDMGNFQLLCQFVAQNRIHFPDIQLLPCAVGDRNEILMFDCNNSGSKISSQGSRQVPCITPQQCFHPASPDFIKMDIEGAELSALRGMSDVIIENRPVLAVCVYHRPEDLYSIPLYLCSLLKDYNFCLRMYGEHLMDLVLYCIPREMYN